MESFLLISLKNIENRFNEVKLILEEANKQQNQEKLYNSLCRSALILLVAHFEGALKDIISSVIDDLNKFGKFSSTSESLQRTFCNYFIPQLEKDSKLKEQSILKLLNTFKGLETKFIKEAFLLKDNKNPTAKLIETYALRFGLKNFFKFIDNSRLDIVFQDSFSEIIEIYEELKKDVINSIEEYPYKINYDSYSFTNSNIDKNRKTFWETFIEELLKSRHNIAHGSEIENRSSHSELEEMVRKVEIISYSFAFIIAEKANPIVLEIKVEN